MRIRAKRYLLLLLVVISAMIKAEGAELSSPDGKIKVKIRLADRIYYSLYQSNEILLNECVLGMKIDGLSIGVDPKLKDQQLSRISEEIKPVVPLKFSSINNSCNVLLLNFSGGYAVEFRAFNDGVAYRFITSLRGDKNGKVKVFKENVTINVADEDILHLQPAKDFTSNYETNYIHEQAKSWVITKALATLPALIDIKKGRKILFAETDLTDYPCLFLRGGESGTSLVSAFSGVALEEKQEGDRFMRITKEAEYIASTSAKRKYPWRYFIITDDDKQLIESTMPVKLAPSSEIKNTGWIRPGQVSWEWWNAASPYGKDVDFVSGFNLETYKYYIDFASKQGIPYIIMDEGWAETVHDPFTPNKKVDLHELIRYGKTKKVDIILWLTWLTVEKNMGLFKTFSDWGIKGVKIDFMDRNDQWMVNYYERVAKEAARNHLLVDFHGSFTPKGLEYKYPNLISYEGVRGLEQMAGCQPQNSVYLPFMRNVVGPMDFTPGAMINMQPEVYGGKRPNSASVGTRVYQLALFVVFESGVQMLCDNPSLYYNEQECTDFIKQVPVSWDETKALVAKAGEVIVVAKRKGKKWFIGGITNGESRELDIKLDFLDNDKAYHLVSYADGINANRQAMDYKMEKTSVTAISKLAVKMARNGGFAAVIEQR